MSAVGAFPHAWWGARLACPRWSNGVILHGDSRAHSQAARPCLSGVGRNPRPRQGLTLLEILIASALTAVLLTALWSMLTIYSGLYDTGQAKTQHAQLARSLQKQLADDLMSVCLGSPDKPRSRRSEPTPNAQGVDQPGSSRSSDEPIPADATNLDRQADSGRDTGVDLDARGTDGLPSTRVTGFTIDSASLGGGSITSSRWVGLVGTPTSLVLDVVVPVDPFVLVGDQSDDSSETLRPTRSRVPELQRITYTFSGPNPLVVADSSLSASALVRCQSTWEQAYAAAPQSEMPGSSEPLAGVQTDTADFVPWDAVDDEFASDLLSTQNDKNQTTVAMSEPIVDRIPEVINFQLRYFDGAAWLTQWDSSRARSLPVAVEVQFDLQP